MQNMVVAAPLLTGTLHFDMEAMADTSLVRVTIYIPGGNTLMSSRVRAVALAQAWLKLPLWLKHSQRVFKWTGRC